MKKLILILGCALICLGLQSRAAHAYTLDGNLSDWGITPFADWTPSGTAVVFNGNNVFGLGTGKKPAEIWDLEMIAFDSDGTNLYYAIMSSSNAVLGVDTDLAIDIGDNGTYDFGVKFDGFDETNQLVQLPVIDVTKWMTKYGQEWHMPLDITAGTQVGTSSAYQRKYNYTLEGAAYGDTYIIEGSINLALLGLDSLCDIPLELLYTKVSCLQDWISVSGVCRGGNCGPTPEIPEPSSILLLSSALLGLGGLRSRRKQG